MSVQAAYRRGRAGRNAIADWTPEERDAYDRGLAELANEPDPPDESTHAPPPAATATPLRDPGEGPPEQEARRSLPSVPIGGSGPGFILGLFTWALVLAYLREGPTGPRRWLKAKFLNDTGAPGGSASSPATRPATGVGSGGKPGSPATTSSGGSW